MNSAKYESLEHTINYTFNNKKLLIQALTHKSSNLNCNNERLEFLGDAVLDLVVGEYLYNKFNNYKEGALSKIRASLVNEDSFCHLAKSIHLDNFIILSTIEERAGGRSKSSILSNAFEALMGAIYIESNIDIVKKIFYKIMTDTFKDIEEGAIFKDYKSKLQEITQDIFGIIPTYIILAEIGPDHNKRFKVKAQIKEFYAIANGNSKKAAQQKAAQKLIDILNARI